MERVGTDMLPLEASEPDIDPVGTDMLSLDVREPDMEPGSPVLLEKPDVVGNGALPLPVRDPDAEDMEPGAEMVLADADCEGKPLPVDTERDEAPSEVVDPPSPLETEPEVRDADMLPMEPREDVGAEIGMLVELVPLKPPGPEEKVIVGNSDEATDEALPGAVMLPMLLDIMLPVAEDVGKRLSEGIELADNESDIEPDKELDTPSPDDVLLPDGRLPVSD
ncbi:uncharacterized protein BKA78DRAFT_314197 [Phyllosticta capitalensis]|uniref:uncharacterized protein n=1 Tax=Phyllosticta capitalensis TaxID=121624 RepID=UPI00312E30F1